MSEGRLYDLADKIRSILNIGGTDNLETIWQATMTSSINDLKHHIKLGNDLLRLKKRAEESTLMYEKQLSPMSPAIRLCADSQHVVYMTM